MRNFVKKIREGRRKITSRDLYEYYKSEGGVFNYKDFMRVRRAFYRKLKTYLLEGESYPMPYMGRLKVMRIIPATINIERPSRYVYKQIKDGKIRAAKGPFKDYSTPKLLMEVASDKGWKKNLWLSAMEPFDKDLRKYFNKQVDYEILAIKRCGEGCPAKYKTLRLFKG